MSDILVVDDDPLASEYVRDTLSEEGHTVYAASDFASMNTRLFERQYALVVLDMNLPGLKGDTLARLVARSLDPKPRIVLFSGLDQAQLRRHARRVGATGYVTKGGPPEDLKRAVEAALKAFEEDRAACTPKAGPAAQPFSTKKGADDVPPPPPPPPPAAGE
jgi:two-component system phosphate regulon response regulator OmpR